MNDCFFDCTGQGGLGDNLKYADSENTGQRIIDIFSQMRAAASAFFGVVFVARIYSYDRNMWLGLYYTSPRDSALDCTCTVRLITIETYSQMAWLAEQTQTRCQIGHSTTKDTLNISFSGSSNPRWCTARSVNRDAKMMSDYSHWCLMEKYLPLLFRRPYMFR